MTREIEVFVHIGAPSTRRDDEIYAAQAQAYLKFRGDIIDVSSHARTWKRTRDNATIGSSEELPVLEADQTTYLDDTQLAYNALDSQLVTSSLVIPPASAEEEESQQCSRHDFTNREAGKLLDRFSKQSRLTSSCLGSDSDFDHQGIDQRNRSGPDVGCPAVKNGKEPPPAQPGECTSPQQANDDAHSQSSYLRSPILNRTNKRRRLNASAPVLEQSSRYLAVSEHNPPGLNHVAKRPNVNKARSGNETPQQWESQDGNETTSELPTSYSLSDITSDSSRAKGRPDVSQRSASNPGPRTGSSKTDVAPKDSTPHIPGPFEGAIARPKAKKAQERSVNPPSSSKPNIPGEQRAKVAPKRNNDSAQLPNSTHTSRQTSPTPKRPTQPPPPAPTTKTTLPHLPKEIHPPPPTTSKETFTTHITPTLHFLSTRPDISQTYKPISTVRALHPLERGYWLLDCGSWPTDAQVEFWAFLERVVGGGKAGWGVWCERDDKEGDGDGDGGDVEVEVEVGLGRVKVFCWGEVVGLLWLLLYVGSGSRVRKCGAVWVDGAGSVVVRMREG